MTAAQSSGRAALGAIVGFLGSMRLAVWIVLLLALLTWLGTFAQSTKSIHDVQREYFESWYVIGELPISFWGTPLWPDANNQPWPLRIPLPGALPLLALLAINLVVGGVVRLRWTWRNAGILVTHAGMLMLLAAGFVKMSFSHAGMLGVFETPADGNVHPQRQYVTSRYSSAHDDELALLIDRGDTIEERVVPEHELWGARRGVVALTGDGLPFRMQVHHWIDHSRALPKGPMVKTLMPVVDGIYLESVPWPPGVQPMSEAELSGCYVTIHAEGQAAIEAILRSRRDEHFDKSRYPFSFEVRGQRYGLELRRVARDLPFTVRLDKFQKRDHPGTISPMDFRSFVTVDDGRSQQEAQIFMNYPLRRDGYVLFQSGWGPQGPGGQPLGPPWYSVFEVADNPSDTWPKIACWVIAAGLLLHFAMKLWRFLSSSSRTALTT